MAKAKTKTKARKIAAQVETNPADVARKIWLAGIERDDVDTLSFELLHLSHQFGCA